MQNLTEAGEPLSAGAESAPLVAILAPAVGAHVVPRGACQIAFGGMVASEPPRVEVHAWLDRLGALTASMTGGQVRIEGGGPGRKRPKYHVRMGPPPPHGL